MDEPAASLDPKARGELKRLIRILAEDGKTILIFSHILSELGEMCDTLLFIDKGRIVHHGTAESLRRMVQEGIPVLEFHREERNLEDAFIDILGKLERGQPPLREQVDGIPLDAPPSVPLMPPGK